MAGELIRATVVGFSRETCRKCHGTGRAGYDARYKDRSHVLPCPCVEFFEMSAVQKSVEEVKDGKGKRGDEGAGVEEAPVSA
jgi:hypothetical protein